MYRAKKNVADAQEAVARAEVDGDLRAQRAAELDAEAVEVPSSENTKKKRKAEDKLQDEPQEKKLKTDEAEMEVEEESDDGADEEVLGDAYPEDRPFIIQKVRRNHTPMWSLHLTDTSEVVPIVLPHTAENILVKSDGAEKVFVVSYTVDPPTFEQVAKYHSPKVDAEIEKARAMYNISAASRKEFETEYCYPPTADKCTGWRLDSQENTIYVFFDRPPSLGLIAVPEIAQ